MAAEPEIAATQDADGGAPGRVDPTWLILQRLDDVRREQDRLYVQLEDLRKEVRTEIGHLRGWFIAGLFAVLAGQFSILAVLMK